MSYSPLPLELADPQDLKPENLLFRTVAEDADIMIADFGLSRVMDEDKHNKLTEICGTPGASFYLLRLYLDLHFALLILSVYGSRDFQEEYAIHSVSFLIYQVIF